MMTKLATTAAATVSVHHFRHVLKVPNEHLHVRSPQMVEFFVLTTTYFCLFSKFVVVVVRENNVFDRDRETKLNRK